MRRDTVRWTLASLVLHAVLVVAALVYSGPSFTASPREVRFLDLSAFADTEARVVDLPPVPRGMRADGVADGPLRAAETPVPVAARADTAPIPVGPPIPSAEVAGRALPDSVRRGLAVARPSYESGRLWVRPMDALARAGGEVVTADELFDNAQHVARIDSAVVAKIRAFLDTLPPDSFALQPPPSWTTEIDGRTWGIDRQWIYLGDLRLPAAVLALLPFPQGNYEQNQRAAQLQRIREDIMQAAWRAESADQFRDNVRKLRERTDREREMRRNQTRRDTTRT